jgi:hypothetical protein
VAPPFHYVKKGGVKEHTVPPAFGRCIQTYVIRTGVKQHRQLQLEAVYNFYIQYDLCGFARSLQTSNSMH